jgi:hypothetical protein
MKYQTPKSILAALVLGAASVCCLLLTGCTSEKQYRTKDEACPYDPQAAAKAGSVIEVGTNYLVGYVEFDDQGWLYGTNRTGARLQIEAVHDRFARELQTNGLLMVVFVHGWKHNAGGGDSNVVMFHHVLGELGVMQQHISKTLHQPPHRVAGVYVGWRGLSASVEPFEELSFWDRKNTAEAVGHGAVIELLSDLEALRDQSNREHHGDTNRSNTKLIILGHSFGGDIVYSATAPILTERMVQNYDAFGQPRAPKSLGDLVVLINPAFEAARFETLQRLASTKAFPLGTNCTLAVFTSTADQATGFFFPLGRNASTLFETYEKHRDQRKANVTAVGHYQPYINYDLKPLGSTVPSNVPATATAPASADKVRSLREQIRRTATQARISTNDLVYTFTHCQLLPRPNCRRSDPVFNVAVDPAIIPNHSTIDRWVFIRFLSEFLSAFSSSGE